MCAGRPAFHRELWCYGCRVGRAVGRRNRPTGSEAKGNEKVLLDFASRDLPFYFQKAIPWSSGQGYRQSGGPVVDDVGDCFRDQGSEGKVRGSS